MKSSSSLFLSFFYWLFPFPLYNSSAPVFKHRNTSFFNQRSRLKREAWNDCKPSKRPLILRSSYNWSSSKFMARLSRSISGFHFPPFTVPPCPQLNSAAFVRSFDDSSAFFVGLSLSPSFLSLSLTQTITRKEGSS